MIAVCCASHKDFARFVQELKREYPNGKTRCDIFSTSEQTYFNAYNIRGRHADSFISLLSFKDNRRFTKIFRWLLQSLPGEKKHELYRECREMFFNMHTFRQKSGDAKKFFEMEEFYYNYQKKREVNE